MHKSFFPAAMLAFSFALETNAEVLELDHVCSYFGEHMPATVSTFGSINEAVDVLDKILAVQGLNRNFEVEAASVPNAAAVIQNEKRMILYNPNFMDDMRERAGTKWAPISILAHEVGHHLQGHTLTRGGSRPPIELEADQFSGFVLQRMGAPLEEALAAMRQFGSSSGSATHPAKNERLAAISAGWKKACDLSDSCSTTGSEDLTNPGPGQNRPTPQPETIPRPQITWTDQCTVNGEPVRVSSSGQVISQATNQLVGHKQNTFWPNNCIFDLVNLTGGRFCVQRSGLIFFGTPQPVGRCSPIN